MWWILVIFTHHYLLSGPSSLTVSLLLPNKPSWYFHVWVCVREYSMYVRVISTVFMPLLHQQARVAWYVGGIRVSHWVTPLAHFLLQQPVEHILDLESCPARSKLPAQFPRVLQLLFQQQDPVGTQEQWQYPMLSWGLDFFNILCTIFLKWMPKILLMQAMEAGLSEVKNELQSRDDLLRIIEMERLHLHRELLKMGECQNAHDNRKRYSSHTGEKILKVGCVYVFEGFIFELE